MDVKHAILALGLTLNMVCLPQMAAASEETHDVTVADHHDDAHHDGEHADEDHAGEDHAGEDHADEEHAGEEHGDEHHHASHVSEMPGVRVVHAWTPAGTGLVAIVGAEVENTGSDPIILQGGSMDGAIGVGLVGFSLKDGKAEYQDVGPVTIAPGTELELELLGLALRIEGLDAPLKTGDTFEMDLVFDTGTLDVDVAVEAPGSLHHSHAGHNH